MTPPTVLLSLSVNVAVGVFLGFLAFALARWSGEGRTRLLLAAYLGLVGANYFLDGLRDWAMIFGSTPWARFVLAFDTPTLVRVALVLDPPALLLFAIATARGRLDAGRALLVALPAAAVAVLSIATLPASFFALDPGLAQPVWRVFLGEMVLFYALAFGLVVARYLREPHAMERDRLGLLVVALGITVLPRLPLLYTDLGYGVRLPNPPGFPHPALFESLLLALLFGLASVAMRRYARPESGLHVERTLRTLGLMLLLPGLTWLLALMSDTVGAGFGVLYSGRWFVFAGFVVAAARAEGFLGLPPRVVRALGFALVALLLTLAGTRAAAIVLAPASTAFLVTGLLGLACVALIVFRSAFGRTPALAWQRLQAYAAQVELGAPEAELAALRGRLGVSAREGAEIERLAAVAKERAPADAPAQGQTWRGRYEVGRVVGVGAFGRVREARDKLTGERVVLKELFPSWARDPAAIERFRREAQVALRVEHPSLVAFRALEPAGEGHVLVLSYVEGETLAERFARGGPLSRAEAMALAEDVLAGLAALHERGIVHRDVKPENVMLRRDGRAVLLDFGCAAEGAEQGTRLDAGHPGTPAYMSPEQARGGRVGPASDLYALALILREGLQGAIPTDWEGPLRAALDPDPSRRFASAEAFRDALLDAQVGKGSSRRIGSASESA